MLPFETPLPPLPEPPLPEPGQPIPNPTPRPDPIRSRSRSSPSRPCPRVSDCRTVGCNRSLGSLGGSKVAEISPRWRRLARHAR